MKEKLQAVQKGKNRAKLSLQEQLLQEAVQIRQNITLILLKGFHVNGTIREYDNFSILIEFEDTQHLVYKHAISTIRF